MGGLLSQYTGKLTSLRAIIYGSLIWLLPAIIILGQPDMGVDAGLYGLSAGHVPGGA